MVQRTNAYIVQISARDLQALRFFLYLFLGFSGTRSAPAQFVGSSIIFRKSAIDLPVSANMSPAVVNDPFATPLASSLATVLSGNSSRQPR